MALVKFGYTVDMSALVNPATPESFLVAYDLDGILKQKDYLGNITPIGSVTSIIGSSSNFLLTGSGIDSLGNKTSSIYRSGELIIGTTQSYTEMTSSTFSIYKNNGGTTSLYFSVNNNSLVINNNNISGNDRFYWDPINSLILDRPGQSNVLSSYGIEISNSGYVNNIYSNSIYMSGTDSYTSMDLVSGFIFNSNNSSTTISATATTFTQTSGYTLTLLSSTFSGNNTQYYPDRSGTFSLVDDIINTSIFYLGGSTTSAADSKTQSVYRTGNIGIGTASPSTKLHIFATQSGAFRLQDGTQADGYILKSDANGLATWAESSVYFNGSANTIPMFTGVSTLGNSILSIGNSRSLIIAGAGIGWIRPVLSPVSYLSVQRAQNQIDFILGNDVVPDESQKSTIISDNRNGLEIRSRTRLILSSDYLERLRIEDGNIGIGLTGPSTKLHIFATQSGAFRLQDGTQGNGYVLTSDANGLATWATTDSINWFRDITNTIYNTNTGGIFLFGSTSSAPDSLTGGGLIIQGSNANNTVYGGNNSNTAIITFMPSANNVYPVDNAVSGIQSCDYNYGNVRAGIYFQSEVGNHGRPAIVFRVGGFSLPEIMRISQLGNIGIGTTQSNMKLHIKGTQSTVLGGGTIPGVFRLEDGTQADGYVLTSDVNGVASWTASRPYKVYTAILSQSGTASPTATVLENNLGFNPVWNRNSAGNYYLSSSNGFPILKTIVFFAKNHWSSVGYDFYVNNEDTTDSDIYISTGLDDLILRTPIEIRVYN